MKRIDKILRDHAIDHSSLSLAVSRGGMSPHEQLMKAEKISSETAKAILEDLLALPVAQDEVSQKLTQSNQEWAKYAHIRNAIRQEWRKALTAYFEGVEK